MTTAVQDGTILAEPRKRRATPIGYGFRYLRTHAAQLSLLLLGPVLLATATDLFAWYNALAKHELFVVYVMFFVAEAWLVHSLSIFAVQQARIGTEAPVLTYGTPLSPLAISARALHLLPKVLLSFALIRVLFLLSGVYPYLLSLAFCFIWAPFFVSGEIFAKELPPRDPDDDAFDDEDEESFGELEEHYFSGHALWQVGFGRSFVFSIANIAVTLELVTLYWAAKAGPTAFVRFVFGENHYGGLEKFLEALLPNIAVGIVLALSSAVFYLMVVRSARDELGLARLSDADLGARTHLRPSVAVLVVALPLATISSWYVFQSLKSDLQMPKSVKIAFQKVSHDGENLTVRIALLDPDQQFRWLVPQNFRLVPNVPLPAHASLPELSTKPKSEGQSAEVKEGENGVNKTGTKDKPPVERFAEIVPERVYVFDNNNKLITAEYRPSYNPLVVEFRFRVPPAMLPLADGTSLRYRAFENLSEASIKLPTVALNGSPFQQSSLVIPDDNASVGDNERRERKRRAHAGSGKNDQK